VLAKMKLVATLALVAAAIVFVLTFFVGQVARLRSSFELRPRRAW
jgi:hypothetical protein